MTTLTLTDSGRPQTVQSAGWASLVQAVALVLPLLAAVAERGGGTLRVLLAALLLSLAWEALFALIRHRALSWHGATTALIVAVMVPPDILLWQLAVALSLGVVLAELVFGGRGFGFVNAGAAVLALLVFSFPQVSLAPPGDLVAVACLPGAALMIYAGLIGWPGAAAFLATLLAAGLLGLGPSAAGVVTPVLFLLVFVIADPMTGAVTLPGRVLHGALAAVLACAINPALTPEALVFAAVLAAVFAPLLDTIAAAAHRALAARRHGDG